MDLVINNLHIPIEIDGTAAYLDAAAHKMNISADEISVVQMLSKAIDLRDQEQFYYKVSVVVRISDSYPNKQKFSSFTPPPVQEPKPIPTDTDRPIVVGFGPAGMFASLELIAHGLKPIIFERGKNIENRSVDVERFISERKLNPESNIQFGEGGAGSYSDGKLFSRRNNNTSFVNKVLQTFVKFGAPPEIEYISKPHLGTDVLCKIVHNIRLYILERGGEIFYESRMTDILISAGQASGIIINDEQEYLSSRIYLALGHSARDTLSMMAAKGVAMEQKPIFVGVRVEHPVETINLMRYGKKYLDYPGLGAATYSLNYTNRKIKRGVYTFCMCPGGEVVNASSEQGRLVLNGMSYSQRSSPFSNAALVATCHASDYQGDGPLAGIDFQKEIERKAYLAGGSNWAVPAQNLMDFLGEKNGECLPDSSYRMGVTAADLRDIYPSFVIEGLKAAFAQWKDEVPLFISSQAIIMAAETRTSSPVKITRDENFESINTKGLFPLGEGAGYTGGITSSAADAIRAISCHFS